MWCVWGAVAGRGLDSLGADGNEEADGTGRNGVEGAVQVQDC